jgi:integrase
MAWLARRRDLQPRSLITYRQSLQMHVLPALGALPITALTRHLLRSAFDALATRGLAPRTIRLCCAILTALLNDAVDAELLPMNPATRLVRHYRAPRQEAAFYTESQLAAFLMAARAIRPTLASFFAIMGKVGLRVGEARALRVRACDLARRVLVVECQIHRDGSYGPVPKGNKRRVVPLVASLIPELAPLVCRQPGWLFPEVIGPNGYKLIWVAMRMIAVRAQVPVVSPKALRHTAGSILIARGESPESVRRILGHADLRTTMTVYSSHLPMQRSAVLDGL